MVIARTLSARLAGTLAALVLVWPPSASADSLSLKEVMRRVGSYVDAYGARASIVVGTERYHQVSHGNAGGQHGERDLVADLGIVKVDSQKIWLGFRDVIEVDGRRVSDRDDRLADVLVASAGRFDEALRISNESARFNIGAVERNFNVPTTALFYFNSENHRRFKFSARSIAADGSWEIAYRETERPTLIRTPEGQSIPSQGAIHVNPDDGTIVRTVLDLQLPGRGPSRGQHGTGNVDVTFMRVEALDMWLPESMAETFESRDGQGEWERVEGHATYTNYRKFQTMGRIK
jgi:hypothetical protein